MTSVALKTLTSSRFHRANTGGGVLPGATKAYQLLALKPGKRDSATVGTLRMNADRVSPVVAIAINRQTPA